MEMFLGMRVYQLSFMSRLYGKFTVFSDIIYIKNTLYIKYKGMSNNFIRYEQ